MSWADIRTPEDAYWPAEAGIGDTKWKHRYRGTYIMPHSKGQPIPECFIPAGDVYVGIIHSLTGRPEPMLIQELDQEMLMARPLVVSGEISQQMSKTGLGEAGSLHDDTFVDDLGELYGETRHAYQFSRDRETKEQLQHVVHERVSAARIASFLSDFAMKMLVCPEEIGSLGELTIRTERGVEPEYSAERDHQFANEQMVFVSAGGMSIPCLLSRDIYNEDQLISIGHASRFGVYIGENAVYTKSYATGRPQERYKPLHPGDLPQLFAILFSAGERSVIEDAVRRKLAADGFLDGLGRLQSMGVELDKPIADIKLKRAQRQRRLAEKSCHHIQSIAFNLGLHGSHDRIAAMPMFEPLRALAQMDDDIGEDCVPDGDAEMPGGASNVR